MIIQCNFNANLLKQQPNYIFYFLQLRKNRRHFKIS